MALTAATLAAALRLGATEAAAEPLAGILARPLAAGTAYVAKPAPDAPEALLDEATVRLAAHLYDQPHFGRGFAMASAWRSSGAAGLVGPWVVLDGVRVDA